MKSGVPITNSTSFFEAFLNRPALSNKSCALVSNEREVQDLTLWQKIAY